MRPNGRFKSACPLWVCSLTSFIMRFLKISPNRGFHARARIATDVEETHGEYNIGELAYITSADDVNYVTSLGVAVRHDHMPSSARLKRDAEDSQAKSMKSVSSD